MVHVLVARVRAALAAHIRQHYQQDVTIVTEKPPRIEMGEAATPVCFELAKRLKRAPRQIAQEIAAQLPPIEGVERVEIAGGGYVNFYFSRAAFLAASLKEADAQRAGAAPDAPKCIVEHTNINPNKAAHIGHLRNAVLGDTFVRLLRRAGQRVEVQNYIDNTGVQVADVVIGFLHIAKKTPAEVRALAAEPKFDYYCWDLYASVTPFFRGRQNAPRLARRNAEIDRRRRGRSRGNGEHRRARHRSLPPAHHGAAGNRVRPPAARERNSAFEILGRGIRAAETAQRDPPGRRGKERRLLGDAPRMMVPPTASDANGEDDDAKIIVRSNGTVTYVGKDIAYQLWKFGLLGRDFHYEKFHTYPAGHTLWSSVSTGGDRAAPAFGRAAIVYNVIDARQAYLQNVVTAGLRALGYEEQADRSVHFSYEIVALTPRCAAELGYTLSEEDAKKPYVEVSGRKGLGVKADDLLDRLEAAARAEVDERHPDTPDVERAAIAHAIAIGALRYFLLKFTRTATIAFDFKDALSFEGETGPYCQYAVVRARNIFRKLRDEQPDFDVSSLETVDASAAAELFAGSDGNAFWELAFLAASLDTQIDAAVGAQEPAFVAKYAFQLAQAFNLFYHHHHILTESDPAKKKFLLQLSRLVEVQLVAALELLGIESPEKM